MESQPKVSTPLQSEKNKTDNHTKKYFTDSYSILPSTYFYRKKIIYRN